MLSPFSISEYLSPNSVNSPLHNAVLSDDIILLKELLASKLYDIDVSDKNERTPLIYSILVGSLFCFEILINNGSDPHLVDVNSMSAIHWSCQIGIIKMVRTLLYKDANVDQKDSEGRIPLHYATLHHDSKLINILLKYMKPSLIDTTDSLGMSALHWSAYHNNPIACRTLIRHNSNPGNPDREGRTPLHLCAGNDTILSIKVLIELAGPALLSLQDFQGCTILHHIVATQNFSLLNALTESPFFIETRESIIDFKDLQHRTALHWAFAFGYSSIADILLKFGASISILDGNGYLPLHYAVERNFVDCIDCFFSHNNLDLPDKENRTSLMLSCQIGHFESAKTIVERNIESIDYHSEATQMTALHFAALSGNISCLKLLVKNGANIDIQDVQGRTPISFASENGFADIVKFLFESGSLVFIPSNDGRLPIHFAVLSLDLETISFLASISPDFSPCDYSGKTPFHYACSTDDFSVLKIFGFQSLNIQDKCGYSPLHLAIMHGCDNTVEYLIRNHAKLNLMDLSIESRTPLDLSIYFNKIALTNFLRNSGCVTSQEIRTLAAIEIQRFWRKYRRLFAQTLRDEATLSNIQQTLDLKQNSFPGTSRRVLSSSDNCSVNFGSLNQIDIENISDKYDFNAHREVLNTKTEAVLILQLWWRRYLRKLDAGIPFKFEKHREEFDTQRNNKKTRELAALLIQLTWRQYVRKRIFFSQFYMRKKIFHWSPGVIAKRQKFILEQLYSQNFHPNNYSNNRYVSVDRPSFSKFIPSPAVISFNFAFNQYSLS